MAATLASSVVPVDEADRLRHENEELRVRLAEAQDTIDAIVSGQVDAVVVGSELYTLESANAAINALRKDVLSQMDDAVVAFDLQDHVIYLNQAAERQYQCPSSDALGRGMDQLFVEQSSEGCTSPHGTAGQPQQSRRVQAIHVLRDGASIHVESTLSPLNDSNGQRIGRLAVIRDVTERFRHEALRQAEDRRKDEFLATLAHELRNPLAPIQNSLQIMQQTADATRQHEARSVITRQVRQMVHLVDDLLDVGRIRQGKLELRRDVIDVVEAVTAALETSRPLIEACRHRLTTQLPAAATLHVDADLTRLTQVIANLLNNAAKYTPENGHIGLSVSADDNEVRIAVRDTGIGIAAADLPRVFDMFSQIGSDQERAQGGLGIGLALVRQLVEMHGGRVAVDSAGTGAGSTFTVQLPICDRLPSSSQPTSPATVHTPSTALRILVADDNVDSAQTLTTLLEMLGHAVTIAFDGRSAFELAEASRPDVAILDLGMPVQSGYVTAEMIRAESWGRDVLLIALSGWGTAEDQGRSRQAGFDRHLVKPLNFDDLDALLASAVRSNA